MEIGERGNPTAAGRYVCTHRLFTRGEHFVFEGDAPE